MFSFWAQEQAKKVATGDMWPENTFRSWEASLKVDWQSCEYLEPIQRVHPFWGLYKNMTQFCLFSHLVTLWRSLAYHLMIFIISEQKTVRYDDGIPCAHNYATKNLHRKMSHKVSWAWRIFPQDTTVSRFRLGYRCVTMALSQASPSLLYLYNIVLLYQQLAKIQIKVVLEKSTAEICLICTNVWHGFRKSLVTIGCIP